MTDIACRIRRDGAGDYILTGLTAPVLRKLSAAFADSKERPVLITIAATKKVA